MTDLMNVNALNDLYQFADKHGVVEIMIRRADKRFEDIQKIVINNLQNDGNKELALKILKELNKNVDVNKQLLAKMEMLTKLQEFSVVLNVLNIGIMMYEFEMVRKQLDEISEKIDRHFKDLDDTLRKESDRYFINEFNKIAADYEDMMDYKKLNKSFPIEDMRLLVDQEYNLLLYLVKLLKDDRVYMKDDIISLLFSILSMFSITLSYFDEQYYFENIANMSDRENPWHSSHNKWLGIYDILSEPGFISLIQDYAYLDSGLNIADAHLFDVTLREIVADARIQVKDNQSLILALRDQELLNMGRKLVNAKAEEIFNVAFAAVDDEIPSLQRNQIQERVQLALTAN